MRDRDLVVAKQVRQRTREDDRGRESKFVCELAVKPPSQNQLEENIGKS